MTAYLKAKAYEQLSDYAKKIVDDYYETETLEGAIIINVDASVDDVCDAMNYIIHNNEVGRLFARKVIFLNGDSYSKGITLATNKSGLNDDSVISLSEFPEIKGINTKTINIFLKLHGKDNRGKANRGQSLNKKEWDVTQKDILRNCPAYLCYGEEDNDNSHLLESCTLTGKVKIFSGRKFYEITVTNGINTYYPIGYTKSHYYILTEREIAFRKTVNNEAKKYSKYL